MLSLLINRCDAEAADLPQLLRLHELLCAEEEGVGGGSAALRTPVTTQTPSAPHLTEVTSATLNATRVAGDAARAAGDRTVLGFLLHHCTNPGEEAEYTGLRQLHGLLLEESRIEDANKSADMKTSLPRAQPPTTVPVHIAPTTAADVISSLDPPNQRVPSGTMIMTEKPFENPSFVSAPEGSRPALSSPLAIPVPIVPQANGWRGTTTFLPASAEASPQPLASPGPKRGASEDATIGVAAAAAESNVMGAEASVFVAKASPVHSTGSELPPRTDKDRPVKDSSQYPALSLPTSVSVGEEISAAQTTREVRAAGEGGRGNLEAVTSPPLRRFPQHFSSVGRMPCPIDEVLAARSSATVRLHRGVGTVQSLSPLPPASRPMSGFARRFISGLYEGVVPSRDRRMSSPIPIPKKRHLQPLYQRLPTGGGARAVRAHRASLERSGEHPVQPRQARQGAGNVRLPLPQERVYQFAQEVVTRPRFSTPTPLQPPPKRSVGGFEPDRTCRISPCAATGSRAVVLDSRPVRPHSSLAHSGRGSGNASADEPLAGLILIGARIPLPSFRPDYSRHP
ncbi:hypothetical protein JKF63_00636 [Porcisia hertigi]|uniref:Uncharacterized protein n=1 Tax=Porcisia hertigi TaxID=2761500 RepID=A0A836HC00_9TRYP|nr:hypothetical protein JKF63_00636 [Porcisia hertigi]